MPDAPGDVATLPPLSTAATRLTAVVAGSAAAPATVNAAAVASRAALGDPATLTPNRAVPGTAPADPGALSADEQAIVRDVIATANRHQNLYLEAGVPYYRGWNYLANLVWYLRTMYNPEGRELTADELAALKKTYGGRNYKIPASGGKPIPTLGPKGWPPAWNAIFFGGVIPFTQQVLKEIRAPDFADIKLAGDTYASTSPLRSYHAKLHGDAAKDARGDSRRLQVLAIGKEWLGTEYAQGHPEETDGKQYGRRPTLDCSGFVATVFSDHRLGFLRNEAGKLTVTLGSQVSTQYATAVRYPDLFRIVKGPKCTRVGTRLKDSAIPQVDAKVEQVAFSGPVLAGDIGMTGMKTAPCRGDDGFIESDFRHVVIFTGRSAGKGAYECIHAPDVGEGVDIGAKSLEGDVGVLIRPVL